MISIKVDKKTSKISINVERELTEEELDGIIKLLKEPAPDDENLEITYF